jgi:predicted transposase YbfD/YdcC
MVESERHIGDTATSEQRFVISPLKPEADKIAPAIRAHWQIENGCHWVLDVTFREDDSLIRRGHGAHNFSTLRQTALSVLKREPTKISIRKKSAFAPDSTTTSGNKSLPVLGFKCDCLGVTDTIQVE